MRIEFDPAKNERNIRERGLSFERVNEFEFAGATISQDVRKPYPEPRFVAAGMLDARLHVLCFTLWLVVFVSSAFAKPTPARSETMSKRPPLVDDEGEVRELTAEDFASFRPAADVLAPELYAGLVEMNRRAGVRGPQKAPRKQPTTIRFDADVLAALRATGKGWQTRVNDAMREWVKAQRAA